MVDGALHVGPVRFTPQLDSQTDRHGTQPQHLVQRFDATLAPKANEINVGGKELTLFLTDL